MNVKIWIGLFLTIILFGCKNDFDLIEDGETLPVVYGFVNLNDTAQYIRVEQSFAEENSNAFMLAQDPDRVFYDNVTVELTNLSTNNSFTLNKVDGNDEGYQRDPGDFLVDPNYLYKIKTSELDFNGGEKMKLTITDQNDQLLTESTTTVLPELTLILPLPGDQKIAMSAKEFSIQLFSTKNVGLIGVDFHIFIRETDAVDPSINDTVEVFWNMTDNTQNDPVRPFQIIKTPTNLFFSAIKNGLDPDANVIRRISHIDIVLKSSGLETLDFRRIALANQGLTGSLELPLYSNLSRGIGIFSSKTIQRFEGYLVTGGTRDSLANGKITGDLNFVN